MSPPFHRRLTGMKAAMPGFPPQLGSLPMLVPMWKSESRLCSRAASSLVHGSGDPTPSACPRSTSPSSLG